MASKTPRGIGAGLMLALFGAGLLGAWAFDAWRRPGPEAAAQSEAERPARVETPAVARSLPDEEPAAAAQEAPEIESPAESSSDARVFVAPAPNTSPPAQPPVSYEERMREQMLRVAATPDAIPTEEEREAFVRYMEEKMGEIAEQQRREEAARAAGQTTDDYRGREAYERYLGVSRGDGPPEGEPEVVEDPSLISVDPQTGEVDDEEADEEALGETELLD